MQSYLSFLSTHNTSTHPLFLFILSNTIIVNLSNNVVVCHATIPLPPCPPPSYLNFTNLPVRLYILWEMLRASPCADFGSFAFLCAKFPDALYTPANSFFWKLSFLKSFMKKMTKMTVYHWQFAFYPISRQHRRADIASGQFSDRNFFRSPVIVRIWSLLSVINIDRLFVCLFVT